MSTPDATEEKPFKSIRVEDDKREILSFRVTDLEGVAEDFVVVRTKHQKGKRRKSVGVPMSLMIEFARKLQEQGVL